MASRKDPVYKVGPALQRLQAVLDEIREDGWKMEIKPVTIGEVSCYPFITIKVWLEISEVET